MIKQRIRRVLLLMLIFVLVGVNFSYAASGTAKVYYQTNGLGYGHVDRVTTLLREMGYTASNAGNITKSTFISGLNNSKVLINVAHGSSSGSIEFSDGLLSTSCRGYI